MDNIPSDPKLESKIKQYKLGDEVDIENLVDDVISLYEDVQKYVLNNLEKFGIEVDRYSLYNCVKDSVIEAIDNYPPKRGFSFFSYCFAMVTVGLNDYAREIQEKNPDNVKQVYFDMDELIQPKAKKTQQALKSKQHSRKS